MNAHTPGPWKMNNVRNSDGSRNIEYAGEPGPFLIATGHSTKANARLIAAAPRMYDALTAIAGMKITEETDKAQVLAICMAIAKTELKNIEGRE